MPVANRAMRTPTTAQPLQFRLAAALVMVKSKPPELSVKDYLHRLRQQLGTGRKAVRGSERRYLDAVAYWKSRNKDSQEEILKLQARIAELEHGKEPLGESGLLAPSSAFPETSSGTRTRKTEAIAQPSGKRKKKATAAVFQPDVDPLGEDFKILATTDAGRASVHHMWQLHRELGRSVPNSSAIAYELCQMAASLAQHVSAAALELEGNELDAASGCHADGRARPQPATMVEIVVSRVRAEMSQLKNAAARIVCALLFCVSRLQGGRSPALNSEQGSVVYATVQLVDGLLDTLTCLSLLKVSKGVDLPLTEDGKSKKKVSRRIEESVSQSIVAVLLATMAALDAKERSHAAIFDGILFYVLNRVGKRTYALTFGSERSNTIEHDIREPVVNPIDSEAESKMARARKAMLLEVDFLVVILRRAMTMAPPFLGASSIKVPRSLTTARPTVAAWKNAPELKSTLSQQAKEKLQSTLIHCMFGDDNTTDGFFERLKMPMPVIRVPPREEFEEENVPEWFRREVWKLVGWDILADDNIWRQDAAP